MYLLWSEALAKESTGKSDGHTITNEYQTINLYFYFSHADMNNIPHIIIYDNIINPWGSWEGPLGKR